MKKRFEKWEQPKFDVDGWAYPSKNMALLKFHSYGWRCQYYENLVLGEKVDIGCFTYLNARYGIEIGDNVQIGSHCSIYSHDTERNIKGKVIIGKNSLIGSHCLILPNVIIPNNSKIKAMSVIK